MTLVQPGSSGTLFRGNVDYRIVAVDMHLPEGEAVKFEKIATSTTDEKAITDISEANFRSFFLDRIAKDLSKYFASYPTQDRMMMSDL